MIALSMRFANDRQGRVLAPVGLATPHASIIGVDVRGAGHSLVADPWTGQTVMVLTPTADEVDMTYRYAIGGAAYPEAMFVHRDSRYTRAAQALAAQAREIALGAGGGTAAIAALAQHVAGQFTYGHPDTRFYDGYDEIPQLCDLAQGSCVDINAYFIANCRAAGIEAGYVTGVFVPEEKRDWCNDMHCWVVTRAEGLVQEWDIAHHLKLGADRIAAGLNPKPGVRVPLAHSMGLNFPDIEVRDLKLIAEPMWLLPDGSWADCDPTIRLDGYTALAA